MTNTEEKETKKNPAVEAANRRDADRIVTLPTGEQAKLVCVTGAMINEITSRIKYPPVPTMEYEDKPGKKFPNPDDPEYRKECDEVERKRGLAAMDAYVMFGVELIDPVPEDVSWMSKLEWMNKKGLIEIDWDEYDMTDPMDKEFVYKKYVAVPNDVVMKVLELSGLSPDRIEEIEDSFPNQ